MFKVVCIKEGSWTSVYNGYPVPGPIKGEIYTVLEAVTFPDGVFYSLKEFCGPLCRANRFRPLISVDDLNIDQYLQPIETLETV